MKAADSLIQLQTLQTTLFTLLENCAVEDVAQQFHPDLSPLGWHLGHCVLTETYWLREVVMGQKIISDEHKQLYIPELSVKSKRSAFQPAQAELCQWAEATQKQNIDYLLELENEATSSPLMKDNYLLFFLGQHYAQHIETTTYVLTQRNLQQDQTFQVNSALVAEPLRQNFVEVAQAKHTLGAQNPLSHYDNECAEIILELDSFAIAIEPVSNAGFLNFIQTDGYQRREFWSDEGWQWRKEHSVKQPQHWRVDDKEKFYGTDKMGAYELNGDQAVSGLSYYEAQALAKFAGAALPHEYQWEAAKKLDLLSNCGQVWEWCSNSLHPYLGFKAFPYDGYSLPWFDDNHFTLRGHSNYTSPLIKRDSFRNFYEADKRHFPAGVRLLAM